MESTIIAVYCESSSAEPSWKYGGRVFQKIFTGLTVGGSAESRVGTAKIWLNEIEVIFFQKVTSTYRLVFNIPYWIRNITVSVYEYTGPIQDTVDSDLQEIKTSLGI